MLSQAALCTTELTCPLEKRQDSSDFSFFVAKLGVSENLELSQNYGSLASPLEFHFSLSAAVRPGLKSTVTVR